MWTWLRQAAQWLPALLMGVKIAWALWIAKKKQEGFREAMKQQREIRIEAERQLALERRRNQPLAVRRDRILADAAAREKRRRELEDAD